LNARRKGHEMGVAKWHLWLGSVKKRPRCSSCRKRWLMFRYTNHEQDMWICLAHEHTIPLWD
jgi:transposase-like protein